MRSKENNGSRFIRKKKMQTKKGKHLERKGKQMIEQQERP